MAKKKKLYDDDDGRTIADMSDIQRQPLLVPRVNGSEKRKKADPEAETEKPEWENDSLSKEQRRAFIGGALSATMLIAGIFIAAAAIVIFIMTTVLK